MKVSRIVLSQIVADKVLQEGVNARFDQEVAAYLLSENRVNELNSIMRDVQADWAKVGIVEVIATSSRKLSPEVRADIKNQTRLLYPSAKRIIITEVLDPEVVGGLRLNLADKQLDLSVRAKLNQFKHLSIEAERIK
jgi:F0F1-type ATP synthase delta subunit